MPSTRADMFIRQEWMELAHMYNPAYLRAFFAEIQRLIAQGHRTCTALDIVCGTFEMV